MEGSEYIEQRDGGFFVGGTRVSLAAFEPKPSRPARAPGA